jgi:hypothetical protein
MIASHTKLGGKNEISAIRRNYKNNKNQILCIIIIIILRYTDILVVKRKSIKAIRTLLFFEFSSLIVTKHLHAAPN